MLTNSLAIQPNVITQRLSGKALRMCSSTLAVYTQTFPAASPFSDQFESLVDEVLTGDPSAVIPAMQQMLQFNYAPLTAYV